jgi:hypothetical protein
MSEDTAPSARDQAGSSSQSSTSRPIWRRRNVWLAIAAVVGISGGVAGGIKAADHQRSPAAAAQRSWHGKVKKIIRGGADDGKGGVTAKLGGREWPLAEGAEVKSGMEITTDARTLVRIDLDDGSWMAVDRATSLSIDDGPRTATVKQGAVVVDVAQVDAAPSAWLKTAFGKVKVLGTKLAVTAVADRAHVEVLRGEVEVTDGSGSTRVQAGQEAIATRDAKLDVVPANDLAQRVAFGERLGAKIEHNEDADGSVSGVGELRARRPGQTNEKDHAVRLSKHSAKIRIVGNVARTELDETFANDTNDDLEGIYRFPLPPGAQIEKLALETDGKLVEGEFIDKAKAAAIWRGAIQNAAPQVKQRDEIIWVPGPWKDPALLEWQRGGRFELKIFPIPKRGSRRVVIAYTETVPPSSGLRRFTYPLPQATASTLKIDDFSVDVQVMGHDPAAGVKVRGYELSREPQAGVERLVASMTGFTPSGDLTVEYKLAGQGGESTAWAYLDTPPPAKDAKVKGEPQKDAYVALALRPKLPRWTDVKPRDQVIVLDAGRGMFGERFERAKRLAIQTVQEMDRRDRVTVLACDVTCRALPGGFKPAGSGTAHDVDAFLSAVTPDGASDLVGSVRAAARAQGHDKDRDLRVVLVSHGVASAGYRRPDRVAAEVSDALGDPRASVVTVPVGTDADVVTLQEIARGGGGVVVPYQPGERLESAALEVLNATYGAALRDVELKLPEGLYDSAPSQMPAIRAGSEAIVVARMKGDHVQGECVLKGKVGGEPFEVRYPIDVRATEDAGNAFVPRLFAAARIADRERDGGESSKAELVALSQRFSVPSRFTSLLVLESEAMFQAFGISRNAHAQAWTGEALAQGQGFSATGTTPAKDPASLADILGGSASGGDLSGASGHARAESEEKGDGFGFGGLGALGSGRGGGGASSGPAPEAMKKAAPPPAPAATTSAAPQTVAPNAPRDSAANPWADDRSLARRRPPSGRWMRRIFVRRANVTGDGSPVVDAAKITAARAALAQAPDERSKHKELAKLLALNGQLDELEDVLKKWSERDPMDVDVITGRADLLERRGDREGALRVLGGVLAAGTLPPADAAAMASAIAQVHERAGAATACAFRVAAAELRPTDAETVARAVSCERGDGHAAAADKWLAAAKDDRARTAIRDAITKVEGNRAENVSFGDIVVDATWDASADADLDIAILDPAGNRAAWASRSRSVRAANVKARDRETLALSSGSAGTFAIELVRADGSTRPVSGKVTVRALGSSTTVPFTLTSTRAQVARVDVRFEEQLVPVDDDIPPPTFAPGPLDRSALSAALANVNVAGCARSGGPAGAGRVTIRIAPSGAVSSAVVDAPFSGTSTGACVEARFRQLRIPAFDPSSGPVTVAKTFRVPSSDF